MIHIVTVHWKYDHWVDIQLKYLNDHISEPFKVYAFLNDLPAHHQGKYFYSLTEPIQSHAVKLNLLADEVARHASEDDDWLIFIDGDAFPIGDIISFGCEKLRNYPLLAIQRRENFGDIQPHPSFCMTTIGFWKKIEGDWRRGYQWRNASGKLVTDVGGNLLGLLKNKGLDWYPMLRSNKHNPHPLFFGIYEDLIYHHGAGFRGSLSRADSETSYLIGKYLSLHYAVMERLPLSFRIKNWLDPYRIIEQRNKTLSEKVVEAIKHDPLFFHDFISGQPV